MPIQLYMHVMPSGNHAIEIEVVNLEAISKKYLGAPVVRGCDVTRYTCWILPASP
jgi:hypothetical protein